MKRILLTLLFAALYFAPGVPLRALVTVCNSLAAGSADSNDVTVTINSTCGNTLAAWVAWYDNTPANLPVLSDTQSNTYIGVTPTGGIGTESSPGGQWYYVPSATMNASMVVTADSANTTFTRPCLAVFVLAGVDAAPLDQQNQADIGSSQMTFQSGGVLPSANAEVVLAGAVTGAITFSDLVSINSGFTLPANMNVTATPGQHMACAAAHLIQTTATLVDPTWTLDAPDYPAGSNITLRMSGGGGGSSGLGPYRRLLGGLL